MLGWVILPVRGTPYTMAEMTWDYCKRVSDRQPMPYANSVLHHMGLGTYLLDNPDVTAETLFGFHVTADSAITSEGIFATDPSTSLYNSYSSLYNAGRVRIPSASQGGDSLIFHAKTDYDNMEFILDPEWIPYLHDLENTVWLTLRKTPNATANVLDAQGAIVDADKRICHVSTTAAQMNIMPGDYYWQFQIRKTVNSIVQRRVPLEGKALVKPVFKV